MPELNIYPGHPLNLSFVARKLEAEGFGLDYWSMESTGNRDTDSAQGRKVAEELLTFLGQYPTNGNRYMLSDISRSMVENALAGRRAKHVEMGFWLKVTEYVVAMARVIEGKDTPLDAFSPQERADFHLARYRDAMKEADPSITSWSTAHDVETGGLSAIIPNRKSTQAADNAA